MPGPPGISVFEGSSLGKHSLDGRDVHEEKTDADRDRAAAVPWVADPESDGGGGTAGTSEKDDAIEKLRYKAAQGDTGAQMELANKYDQGDGVPRDEIEAAKWVRRAARKGMLPPR